MDSETPGGGVMTHSSFVELQEQFGPPSPSDLKADLWSEPTAFGERAHFRAGTRPGPAVLSVDGVRRFDAGTYTCRVDFRQSPTIYHHVTLDVIGKTSKLCLSYRVLPFIEY